eukprot:3883855-Rhodomonas_salina.1
MEEAAEEGGSKKARGSSAAGPEDPSDKGRWLRLLMQLPCPPQTGPFHRLRDGPTCFVAGRERELGGAAVECDCVGARSVVAR